MSLSELRVRMAAGILSFPVTHMKADGAIAPTAFGDHVAWLSEFAPGALFVAGGTGEMFSLSPDEILTLVKTAKAVAPDTPIIAGVGYGGSVAIDLARAVQAAGADGILLLPHYLIEAPQQGMIRHVKAVCDAVRIGVIIYNRDYSQFTLESVEALAAACPNLIGFKDGSGDIETVASITAKLGDRLSYVGGMPTHETFARAYAGAGMGQYSSAVFNFIPEFALAFRTAFQAGDNAAMDAMLRNFFVPLIRIRRRQKGNAVAMIKSGLRVVGRPDPGPVRAPLSNLSPQDEADLHDLVMASVLRVPQPAA